jgi:hypothetical protein
MQLPESFLSNGSGNTFPRQQWEYCWKRCFLLGTCKRVIRRSKNSSVEREPPFIEDSSPEAEE